MKHRTILALTASIALLGACEREREPLPPAVAEGNEVPEEAARIAVQQHEEHGQYLSDADGRTLYVFTADEQGERSACFNACAETWPPVFTQVAPEAAHPAVDPDELDVIERDDDTLQATYNGWPLYYYVRDARPLDMEGHGLESFGGEWLMLGPDGEHIDTDEDDEDDGIVEEVIPD